MLEHFNALTFGCFLPYLVIAHGYDSQRDPQSGTGEEDGIEPPLASVNLEKAMTVQIRNKLLRKCSDKDQGIGS